MRLIDADELITILDEELQEDRSLPRVLLVGFGKQILNDAPTVDAEPTRHGNWDDKMVAFYRVCSECGAIVRQNTDEIFLHSCMVKVGKLNYCPNCGAKMDGQQNG